MGLHRSAFAACMASVLCTAPVVRGADDGAVDKTDAPAPADDAAAPADGAAASAAPASKITLKRSVAWCFIKKNDQSTNTIYGRATARNVPPPEDLVPKESQGSAADVLKYFQSVAAGTVILQKSDKGAPIDVTSEAICSDSKTDGDTALINMWVQFKKDPKESTEIEVQGDAAMAACPFNGKQRSAGDDDAWADAKVTSETGTGDASSQEEKTTTDENVTPSPAPEEAPDGGAAATPPPTPAEDECWKCPFGLGWIIVYVVVVVLVVIVIVAIALMSGGSSGDEAADDMAEDLEEGDSDGGAGASSDAY